MHIACSILLLVLLPITKASESNSPSSLGIFDAIFEGNPESGFEPRDKPSPPPDQPRSQIQSQTRDQATSRVRIRETTEGLVYYVSGDVGERPGPRENEGFLVYAERKGSWRLSAKVRWIDRPKTDRFPWPQAGVIVREMEREFGSKSLGETLTVMNRSDSINTRLSNRARFRDEQISNLRFNEGTSIYLRVTRAASLNQAYSEWSSDGVTWNPHTLIPLELRDNAAYGLIVSGGNERTPARAEFSEVKLVPANDLIPLVRRLYSTSFFLPGSIVDATLEINNPNSNRQKLKIEEAIPTEWIAQNLSHKGIINDSTLTWNITVEPGITEVSYQVIPKDLSVQYLDIQGTANGFEIQANQYMSLMQTEMPGLSKSVWRYWQKSDGLELVRNRFLSVSAAGSVITNKNETQEAASNYARLDGYSVTTILNEKSLSLPRESAFGEIWAASFSGQNSSFRQNSPFRPDTRPDVPDMPRSEGSFMPDSPMPPQNPPPFPSNISPRSQFPRGFVQNKCGLWQYRDGQWISYVTPEIQANSNFFSLIPGATSQVFIASADRILEFNAVTKSVKIVRDITTGFRMDEKDLLNSLDRDGNYWIGERNGLVKMTLPTPWNGLLDVLWDAISFESDSSINRIRTIRGNQKTGLVLSYGRGDSNLAYFKDGQFHASKKPGTHYGIMDEQGTLWVINPENNTLSRIDRYGNETVLRDDFFPLQTTDIAADPFAGFWVATRSGLAKNMPPLWNSPPEIAGMDQAVNSIFEDAQGQLWFSTVNLLLCLKADGNWRIYHYPPNIQLTNFLNALYSIPRTSWIAIGTASLKTPAGEQSGLLGFDPEKEQFITIQVFENELGRINPSDQKILPGSLNGTVWKIRRTRDFDRPSRLSITRDDGIKEETIVEIQDDDRINVIRVEENGDVWATAGDAIRLYRGSRYQYFPMPKGCNGLFDVGNGKLWGGMDDLFEFDGQNWKKIRSGFGAIYSIFESSDRVIWVASEKGLWRYRDETWIQYETEEGLPSNVVFAVFEDSQKRLWVGTAFGLGLYHPEIDPDPPETIIRSREYVDRIPLGTEMRVGYTGNDRWKYTETRRLLYSTQLNEGKWSAFSPATVYSATGLNANDHVLRVRSMDRNGNIDPTPETFRFQVLLPWHRQPAFLISAVFGVMMIVFSIGYALNRHLRLRQSLFALEKSNTQLQEAHDDLQIANNGLNEANTRLQELDKMKTAFVSQASHDLRTPLTAIKGSLDNLLLGVAGEMNDKQERIIERAVTSVDRLTDLINNILDLNRIESGRVILEKTNIPIKTLVENILQENHSIAEHRNIELLFQVGGGDYILYADGGKISRVVGELIGNAIKYTPDEGTILVTLDSRDGEAPGEPGTHAIVLTVRDSGIGMSFEECSRIWERFYRTNASKQIAKGSGLGLSIAKELVELHGGTLSVESAPGRGSVFTLLIPTAKQ